MALFDMDGMIWGASVDWLYFASLVFPLMDVQSVCSS